jgi:hypothetical protein
MAITVSDISALVARFGNEIVHEQSNQAAPLRQHFKEHKEGGRVGIVNPKEGEVSSVGWLADSGTLPDKRNVTPVQFTYLPKFLYGKLGIPRGAATLATGEGEGINLVKEELESLGASLGRQLERAILGSTIETLTAATEAELDAAISAGGQSTMTTSNPEAYRVGMIVERRSSGAGVLEELMRVAKVEYSAGSATATVTFDRSSGITQTNAGNLAQTGYGYASTVRHGFGHRRRALPARWVRRRLRQPLRRGQRHLLRHRRCGARLDRKLQGHLGLADPWRHA